jgi:hypothetical protein
MAFAQEKPFERRRTGSGACCTTCMRCSAIAGTAFWEVELDEIEAWHVCKAENLRPSLVRTPPQKFIRRETFAEPAIARRSA